jgi:hypothetical protein
LSFQRARFQDIFAIEDDQGGMKVCRPCRLDFESEENSDPVSLTSSAARCS